MNELEQLLGKLKERYPEKSRKELKEIILNAGVSVLEGGFK